MQKSRVNIKFDLDNRVMKLQEEGKDIVASVPMDSEFYDLTLLGIPSSALEDLNNFRMGYRLIHIDQGYLAFQTATNKVVVVNERNPKDLALVVLNEETYFNVMIPETNSYKKLYSMLEHLSYSYNKLSDEAFTKLVYELDLGEFLETALMLYKKSKQIWRDV